MAKQMYLVTETLTSVGFIDSVLGIFDAVEKAEAACYKSNHMVMKLDLNEDLGADRLPPVTATEEQAWFPVEPIFA